MIVPHSAYYFSSTGEGQVRVDNGGVSVSRNTRGEHENIREIFDKIPNTNIISSLSPECTTNTPCLIYSLGVFFEMEIYRGMPGRAKASKGL